MSNTNLSSNTISSQNMGSVILNSSSSATGYSYNYNITSPVYSTNLTTGINNLSGLTNYTISSSSTPSSIFCLANSGKEIVRLNVDGTVTWTDDINIDEAAKAFTDAIQLGAEMCAGITKRVKLEIRDSVFNDIIEIARSKGSLTADDLTYLLQASKIVEKLKDGER